MNNFDEYVRFVVGAKIAGQEIERRHLEQTKWHPQVMSEWNWHDYVYRIKLPKGWEYLIEDGQIAFREPNYAEWYIREGNAKPLIWQKGLNPMGYRPIIKKKKGTK